MKILDTLINHWHRMTGIEEDYKKINWCKRVFGMLFAAFGLSYLTGPFVGLKFISETAAIWIFAAGMMPFLALGSYVYDKFAGAKLRARGWNEYSLWHGFQLECLLFLTAFVMPMLLLLLISKIC